MRDVVVYMLLSLDGVAESPDSFITTWDDALDANLADVIDRQDLVILGRGSYDEWASYWPTSDVEPFATFINAVEKHVATSSPLDLPWAGSSVIHGDLVEHVRGLKATEGREIGVHASISVARVLLSAGVVDEIRLVVAPAIAGSGRRFLDGLPTVHLELLESETSPSGSLILRYRVLPG